MANVAAHKTIAPTFSEGPEWVKLTYDFSNDGGTTTTYDLATFGGKALILRSAVHVETACTSGGSATVAIGINDADTDAFMDTTTGAVANLVDDFAAGETTDVVTAASADTVRLTIATAALTAGKINVWLQYVSVV